VTTTSLLLSFVSLQVEIRKNWVTITSLSLLPCSQQKIKGKKRQRHACAVTFFSSNKTKKQKKRIVFSSSQAKEKKKKHRDKKMQ